MNSNDTNESGAVAASKERSIVTFVYHPKHDPAKTIEELCEEVVGGKISISYLKHALQLRVVKSCDIDGSNPVVIAYD